MTALARRRRRSTVVASIVAVVMIVGASAMAVIGAITLSNSREGEAVGIDDRPRATFPATPNGLLAVTDDEGALASLVVMTLLPEGQGGSIVTVPVNADASAGFGLQRRPLEESFDPDDPAGLVASVEEMLSIRIQRAAVVDAEGLAALLPSIDSLQVVLPQDVIDTDSAGDSSDGIEDVPGLVVAAGPQTLTPDQVVEVLTAIDEDGESYDHHEIDVEMWAALSRTAPLTTPPEPVTTDDVGAPAAPASMDELVDRLWQGDVGVRDIARLRLVATDNPTDADVVLLDRRDSGLVFAQISPGLVSNVTSGPTTRVVAAYTDDQIAESGGVFESTSELVREFIGQMLFVGNTVVSVDPTPSGAPEVTVIEVADERMLADVEAGATALFGEADVRLADTVIEGVDIEVTLGMAYLRGRADASSTSGASQDDAGEDTPVDDTTVPGTTATTELGTVDAVDVTDG